MNRKIFRTGGKRLFAVLLTLFLVFGLVSPRLLRAAGEVNATLEYSGFGDQPTINNGRWLIYANLSTAMTTTFSGNPHIGNASATASVNGEVKSFSMYVHAYSTSRIFYIMNYSQLGVSAPSALPAGTTVTIKAGTMTGYVNVQNDFTIYWTGSGWKEIREWDSSKNTFYARRQNLLAVTNTDLQVLCSSGGITGNLPLAGIGDACVYLNGNPTSKKTVNYHSTYGLYLDASSIKGSNYTEGDVLRVKGMFSQTVNSNMYYMIDESFVCIATSGTNDATWVYRSPLTIKQNTTNTLYLTAGRITANGSDYNVFGSIGATVTYNGTAVNRASNNYFLYSKSNDALRIYLPEYKDGSGNSITDIKEGDIIYISGTFTCNGKPVNFGDNWFILQNDGTWLHTTEEPNQQKSFTITDLAESIFQDEDINPAWSTLKRWSMKFATSESLGSPSALTYLGAYKILVNGGEQSVPFYVTTDGKLQIFIGQAVVPKAPSEGTIVTIPAQELGEDYKLTEDYAIIYDDGNWKQYHAGIDTLLAVHESWGGQNLAATIYPKDEASEPTNASLGLGAGVYLVPAYQSAGIWYNGEKLDSTKGVRLDISGQYVRYRILMSAYGLTAQKDDIITVKGVFYKDSVYLNFREIHLKYNGSKWSEIKYSYDDLTIITLDKLLFAKDQDTDSQKRWLFKMQPSVPLEAKSGDYVGYAGEQLQVQIYHEDTPGDITDTTSWALHAKYEEQNGYFGFILKFDVLPKNADGYVVVIKPGIFQSTNYIYKLGKEYKMVNVGGTWKMVQERPVATGVTGDANGDGVVNSADIVREKLELADLALCTEDAFLNGKKEILRPVDLISLYEIILRGNMAENVMPVYLEDDQIMLAAYEGPRRGGMTNYHYDSKLVYDGKVEKSYLNATEFKRFADAGLNTVYVQADASFDSKALRGANDAMLQNLNTYMDLAAAADVDVIVYSDYLNSYLKGKTSSTWQDAALEMNEENLAIELEELWNGHANAKGMKEYGNFKGIMMSDELDSSQLDEYTTAVNVLKNISSDIGFYNTQHSVTVPETHFEGTGGSTPAERFTNAAKAFGTVAGNFTYDMYPLRKNSSGSAYTNESWLYNLQLLAETGKENGFDTGVTVQSAGQVRNADGYEDYRIPNKKADIGFQVYSALAYGMKSVTYYTYWEHHAQYFGTNGYEAYTSAMVHYPDDPEAEGAEGVETDVYRAVQAVNNEINKFDHVFMEYDWLGTITLNKNNNNNLFTNLTSYASTVLSSSDSTDDALVGCMRDDNQGFDGFWLVSVNDPTVNASTYTNTVTVKFNGGVTRLMVYDPTEEGFDGRAKVIAYDTENGYSATLGSCEGQFIIPLK